VGWKGARRTLFALATLAAVAGAGAAAGATAPRWTPPADFPFASTVSVSDASVNAAGDAVLGITVDGAPAVLDRQGARGAWGAATALATPAGLQPLAVGPTVRVNARGERLAVWGTTSGQFVAAHREPGGKWSTGAALGIRGVAPTGFPAGAELQVALADDGRAWVGSTWCSRVAFSDRSGPCTAQIVEQAAAGGPWTRAAPDLELPVAQGLRLALDRVGGAVAAWTPVEPADATGLPVQVVAATLTPGGWGPAEQVSTLPPGLRPLGTAVALGDAGDAAVAWTPWRQTVPRIEGVQVAVRPAGAAWGAPGDLDPARGSDDSPVLTVDSAGNVLATWRGFTAGGTTLAASVRPRDAAVFGAPATLFTPQEEGDIDPHAALRLVGDRAVVVMRTSGNGAQLFATLFTGAITADPGWRPIEVPHWDNGPQAVAVAPNGGALAAGIDHEGLLQGTYRSLLRVEDYDAFPAPRRPQLRGLHLERRGRGWALVFVLTRRARADVVLRSPRPPTTPLTITLPRRTLGPGRHVLPVQGLGNRPYRVFVQLCTSATGCQDQPFVEVRPSAASAHAASAPGRPR